MRGGSQLYRADTALGRDESALQSGLSDEVSRLILAGLQASSLPGKIGEYVNSFTIGDLAGSEASAVVEAARNAQAMADAVRDLGGVFGTFSGLTVQARGNLASLTGGLDQFVSKTQSFVANFFSQEEQAGISAAGILRTLGASGIDAATLTNKSGFRALVDSLDLTSSAGQAQFAALLNSQGPFAGLSEFLATSGMTLGQAAALAPGGGAYEVLVGQADSATVTADATTSISENMTDLVNVTTQGYAEMTTLLTSIDARLANVETAGTLAGAAPVVPVYEPVVFYS